MKTLHAKAVGFGHNAKIRNTKWTNFDFNISQGELVAIIGSSGVGKTTLLRVLSGLHAHESGQVYIDSPQNPIVQPRSPVFIVFQDYGLTLLPWLSVQENILLACHKSLTPSPHSISYILSVLFPNSDDHDELLVSYPDQLSGGQRQRVQIARALASNADFIFFDEPDTGVDILHKLALRRVFFELVNNHKKGIVLISHDLENVYHCANRFYVIVKSKANGTFTLAELSKGEFSNWTDFRESAVALLRGEV